MSKEEVLKLMLPMGFERDSPGEQERMMALRNAGDAAYPALAEIFLENDKGDIAGEVVSVFTHSKGDKTIPLHTLREYIRIHRYDEPPPPPVEDAVFGLGALGKDEEDATLLRDLLNVDSLLLRHTVEFSLNQMETRIKNAERDAKTNNRRSERTSHGNPRKEADGNGSFSLKLLNTTFEHSLWPWLIVCALAVAIYRMRFGKKDRV